MEYTRILYKWNDVIRIEQDHKEVKAIYICQNPQNIRNGLKVKNQIKLTEIYKAT